MYYFVQSPGELKEAREYVHSYVKTSEKKPLIGFDTEGFSLTGNFPKPIPYYGENKEDLTKRVFIAGQERVFRADYEGQNAMFQVGLDPEAGHDVQFLLDVRTLGEKAIAEAMKFPLENSVVVGHNLTYDAMFLIAHYDIWLQDCRDTRSISKIIHAGDKFTHDLGTCYRKFLDAGWFHAETGMTFGDYEKFKKENQVSDWLVPELTEDQLQYAADDVRLLLFMYHSQKDALKRLVKRHNKAGLYDTVKLDCGLTNEFALMELLGVPVDVGYHYEEVVSYLEQKKAEAMEEIGKHFTRVIQKSVQIEVPSTAKNAKPGQMAKKWIKIDETVPINPKSPGETGQVCVALREAGVKVEYESKGKKKFKPIDDSKEKTLKRCRDQHVGIEAILKYKKAADLSNNYGEKMIADHLHSDGKIHATFSPIGAETGRSSSSKPNMMKIPARELLFGEKKAKPLFRTSFYATAGYTWISCDLSQIEPCMIAEISGDEALIEELSAPDSDIHGKSAQLFMDLPYKPQRGDYDREFIGKTGNLQVFYKVGARSFAAFMYDETIDLAKPVKWSKEEAQEKIDRFFQGFPRVKAKMDWVEQKIQDYLEPFQTLKYLRGRKPAFEIFTGKLPRYRKWCLTEKQEALARIDFPEGDDPLHRWFRVWDEDKEKFTTWNERAKLINRISREAWNFLFQGECANLFKVGVSRIGPRIRAIPGFDWRAEGIVSVVHDEVNLIVKDEHVDQVMEIVQDCMLGAGREFITKVPVKVSIAAGRTWADAH